MSEENCSNEELGLSADQSSPDFKKGDRVEIDESVCACLSHHSTKVKNRFGVCTSSQRGHLQTVLRDGTKGVVTYHVKFLKRIPLPQLEETDLIVVCSACLRASCWNGLYIFSCDEAVSAGTVNRTVKELRELGKEPESHWKVSK